MQRCKGHTNLRCKAVRHPWKAWIPLVVSLGLIIRQNFVASTFLMHSWQRQNAMDVRYLPVSLWMWLVACALTERLPSANPVEQWNSGGNQWNSGLTSGPEQWGTVGSAHSALHSCTVQAIVTTVKLLPRASRNVEGVLLLNNNVVFLLPEKFSLTDLVCFVPPPRSLSLSLRTRARLKHSHAHSR